MFRKRVDGYPPRHRETVRAAKRGLVLLLTVLGIPAAVFSTGYLRDWPEPLFALAPVAVAVFLFHLVSVLGVIHHWRVVCILPYFKKDKANPMLTIRGDTFLTGHALARHCTQLDELAREIGLEPLSHFGFADDLAGEEVRWYEAARGLATVSGLLQWLRDNPARMEETPALIDDLSRIQDSLRNACELEVPFCFLLRHGSTASGQEMDARQGFFSYS